MGLYVLFPGGCRWGELGEGLVGSVDGVVGPGVSKTEGIKASVAWVSPRNRAMAWCFRCVSGVLRCRAASARADLLRFGHLAPSLRHADIRAGPSPQRVGLGWDARGRVSIVVDEGLHRQRGCGADHEGRGLIIRDGRRRSRPPATRSVGRSPRKASRSSSCSSAGCRLLWRTAADRSPMRLRTP